MNTPKADASESFRGDSATFQFAVPSQKQFFLILFVYFGLQTLIRVLISGTIDLDESEQLILTQKFTWGYGSQPPLYTWIQMLFFKAFGVSVFALALFKNLLLFSIYAFTYLNTRLITRSHVCGMLGAVCLLFVPQIVWESQRDLTHSVLASTFVAATLFVFLRLRENSWRGYAMLGFCFGLGILSKYNYAAFLFGLILSALTLKQFRPLILNKRAALSLVICLVVLLPHLLWTLNNRESLTTTTYKFHQEAQKHFVSIAATGLGNLLVAVISYVAPALAIFAAIFHKNILAAPALIRENSFARLFLRKYGFIMAGLIVVVLALRVTGFKDRWFQPIFISLPLFLFALAQNWVGQLHFKRFLALGGVVALLVLVLIPSRIIFAEKIGRPQSLNAPFRQMKSELAVTIPTNALVIAESKWLGGNLRLLFPTQNVITPELAKLYPASNRVCVLVWDATKEKPKSAFVDFCQDFAAINLQETKPIFVEGKHQHFRAKKFRLGISANR